MSSVARDGSPSEEQTAECTPLSAVERKGWLHRWSCLLGCTAAKSFAASDIVAVKVGACVTDCLSFL